ncbi:hypothetical protein PHYSODRAFT_505584, partial [Phytophthora sojae]
QNKKPFSRQSYKSGHYAPAERTNDGPVGCQCNKPGHFKRGRSTKLKGEQENDEPRQ